MKTTTIPLEDSMEESTAAIPERGRYLRRKTVQKLRQTPSLPLRLKRVLPVLAKGLFLLAVAGFIVSVFNYAYTSEKFKLRSITFHGCKQIDCASLEQVVRQSSPSNILSVDLYKVRNRIESEPWARRVEVRRVLPSELVIYIQERVPSVVMEVQGELMLADEEGVLLDRYDPKYGKLDVPIFKGFLGEDPKSYRQNQEENSVRVRQGRRMLLELEQGSPLFTRRISEVDLTDKGNIRLLLVDDTAEVFLGDRDFLKRFQMLAANSKKYQELKAQYGEIATIDLRFDGQIVYRPRKGAERETEPNARTIGSR